MLFNNQLHSKAKPSNTGHEEVNIFNNSMSQQDQGQSYSKKQVKMIIRLRSPDQQQPYRLLSPKAHNDQSFCSQKQDKNVLRSRYNNVYNHNNNSIPYSQRNVKNPSKQVPIESIAKSQENAFDLIRRKYKQPIKSELITSRAQDKSPVSIESAPIFYNINKMNTQRIDVKKKDQIKSQIQDYFASKYDCSYKNPPGLIWQRNYSSTLIPGQSQQSNSFNIGKLNNDIANGPEFHLKNGPKTTSLGNNLLRNDSFFTDTDMAIQQPNKVSFTNELVQNKPRNLQKDLRILKQYGNQVKNFNITVTNVMETDKELLSSRTETHENKHILNQISDNEDDHISQTNEDENFILPRELTPKNLGDINQILSGSLEITKKDLNMRSSHQKLISIKKKKSQIKITGQHYQQSPLNDERKEQDKIFNIKKNLGLPQNESLLAYHDRSYKEARKNLNYTYRDNNVFKAEEDARKRLKKNSVPCFKYNYALDDSVQNFANYPASIQLSSDEQKLIIKNLKPVNDPKYVLEADSQEILKHKANDVSQQQFQQVKSNGSCKLKDIKSISFGGCQSRFWMLRKHMNSMESMYYQIENVPFYSWQCLTLQLGHRDVDLVIKNEKDMDDLLRILVFNLNTVDGQRDSQDVVTDRILTIKEKNNIKLIKHNKTCKRKQKPKLEKVAITKHEREKIYYTTLFKFKLMRIRAKISFMAFIRNNTISEMFLKTIETSYHTLIKLGEIEQNKYEKQLDNEQVFHSICSESLCFCIKLLMKIYSTNSHVAHPEDKYLTNQLAIDNAISFMLEQRQEVEQSKNKYGQTIVRCKFKSDDNYINKRVKAIKNKQTSLDLFAENELGQDIDYSKLVAYKTTKLPKTEAYNNLKMIINFKMADRILFIKLALHKIKLAKELFILDLEQGQEVFIPKEFSLDGLPLSFQYYDQLLNFCQENVSEQTKQFYKFKNLYRLNFFKNENVKQKVMEWLGIIEPDQQMGKQSKLSFKHKIINEKEQSNINHNKSIHTMSLQKSKYLIIDDDISSVQNTFRIYSNALKDEVNRHEIIRGGGPRINNLVSAQSIVAKNSSQLILRFCPPIEVNKKRHSNCIQKFTFLQKLNFLKSLGKKQQHMLRLEKYLDENLDKLWEEHKKNKKNMNLHAQKCSINQKKSQLGFSKNPSKMVLSMKDISKALEVQEMEKQRSNSQKKIDLAYTEALKSGDKDKVKTALFAKLGSNVKELNLRKSREIHEQVLDYKEKQLFKEEIYKNAEIIINKKIVSKRKRNIDNLKANVNTKMDYQKKIQFFETKLGDNLKYFTYKQNHIYHQMMKAKRTVEKNQKAENKKEFAVSFQNRESANQLNNFNQKNMKQKIFHLHKLKAKELQTLQEKIKTTQEQIILKSEQLKFDKYRYNQLIGLEKIQELSRSGSKKSQSSIDSNEISEQYAYLEDSNQPIFVQKLVSLDKTQENIEVLKRESLISSNPFVKEGQYWIEQSNNALNQTQSPLSQEPQFIQKSRPLKSRSMVQSRQHSDIDKSF